MDILAKLVVLRPASTVFDAAHAMQDNHVGAVLVADHGHLVGIVTDRDVALAVARNGFDARATLLADVMTHVVGTCDEHASVADLVTTMRQYACRRVPLTADGRVVGLVTLDDLVLERLAAPDDMRAVIAAQLEQPARLKPGGLVRPSPHPAPPADERRAAAIRRHQYGVTVDPRPRLLRPPVPTNPGLAATRLCPSRRQRATVLGGVNGSLAVLGGCAAIDTPCARPPRLRAGDGQTEASGGGSELRMAGEASRWSPQAVGTAATRPTAWEATDGSVHGAGCSFAKLHPRGRGRSRQAAERASARDQRQGAGPMPGGDRRHAAPVLRGGDPERLALRAARAPRRRDRGGAVGEAARQQERLARCLGTHRAPAHGSEDRARLQGAATVHGAAPGRPR